MASLIGSVHVLDVTPSFHLNDAHSRLLLREEELIVVLGLCKPAAPVSVLSGQ